MMRPFISFESKEDNITSLRLLPVTIEIRVTKDCKMMVAMVANTSAQSSAYPYPAPANEAAVTVPGPIKAALTSIPGPGL